MPHTDREKAPKHTARYGGVSDEGYASSMPAGVTPYKRKEYTRYDATAGGGLFSDTRAILSLSSPIPCSRW